MGSSPSILFVPILEGLGNPSEVPNPKSDQENYPKTSETLPGLEHWIFQSWKVQNSPLSLLSSKQSQGSHPLSRFSSNFFSLVALWMKILFKKNLFWNFSFPIPGSASLIFHWMFAVWLLLSRAIQAEITLWDLINKFIIPHLHFSIFLAAIPLEVDREHIQVPCGSWQLWAFPFGSLHINIPCLFRLSLLNKPWPNYSSGNHTRLGKI